MNIKNLKPSKGRFKQGYVNPQSCKKLFESQKNTPIIYRSSYEKVFIQWLESNKNVVHWGSECVKIPYVNKATGEKHTYYPDYVVEKTDGVYLIEIKPYSQTRQPVGVPRESYQWQEYVKNISKWEAAQEFCEQHNMKFKILTEHTITRL